MGGEGGGGGGGGGKGEPAGDASAAVISGGTRGPILDGGHPPTNKTRTVASARLVTRAAAQEVGLRNRKAPRAALAAVKALHFSVRGFAALIGCLILSIRPPLQDAGSRDRPEEGTAVAVPEVLRSLAAASLDCRVARVPRCNIGPAALVALSPIPWPLALPGGILVFVESQDSASYVPIPSLLRFF